MIRFAACLLAACGSPPARPLAPTTDVAIGTARPYTLIATPPDGRWAIFCQARADTDKDGKIEVFYELHGEEGGDRMVAYLIDPQGRETVIDNLLAHDTSGRWLAVVERDQPVLIDTTSWKREPLTGTLPGYSNAKGMRRWAFDPRGEHLLFFRNDAPIVRDLATGNETTIAKAAWQAQWSPDGSWVELDILDADTNHDGFMFGPEMRPPEGVPGHDCGSKFDWDAGGFPDAPDPEKIEAVINAMNSPDKLTHRLWRVSDGFTLAAQAAVDHDTVITSGPTGLAIGPVGAAGAPLGADGCEVPVISAEMRAVIVVCQEAEESFTVTWVRDKRHVLLGRVDDNRMPQDAHSFFDFGTSLVNMRTGEIVARGKKFLWARWNDDERAFVLIDQRAELRWANGKVVAIPTHDGSDFMVAGHYFLHAHALIDLSTGSVVKLPVEPIAVRSDGAVLVDGGKQPEADDTFRGPRVGPLRWMH